MGHLVSLHTSEHYRDVLQGTWASLLHSTLSMAVYEASITQLPHHHLPLTSWWAAAMIKQEYLNWKQKLWQMGWPE